MAPSSTAPKHLGLSERCILGFSSGPPILSNAYNNNLQIVQTRDYVVIHTEMIHEARIVPLDGRRISRQALRHWLGDSRGRWDGETLVIETTNFTDKSSFSGSIIARGGSTASMHLVERFTRAADDTLLYEFTVTDPATWTKPWTVQLPMTRSSEQHLRVRVPRGELQHAEHAEGRAGGRTEVGRAFQALARRLPFRPGVSSLSFLRLLGTRSTQDVHQTVVALVARVLEHRLIRLLHRHERGERSREG